MPTIICRKHGGMFFPVDDADRAAAKKIPQGGYVSLEFSTRRSWGNHKRYFAFIKQAFDMQDAFDNQEMFRKFLQVKAGHVDLMILPTGKSFYLPKSIDWSRLPEEEEFRALFGQVLDAFWSWYEETYPGRLTDNDVMNLMNFM